MVNKFNYDCTHMKDPVPKVHEKPVQGLSSGKNFIVTNAIENILSSAKKPAEPVDYLRKQDYGRTPEYLETMKDNIHKEYTMLHHLRQQYENNP